MKGERGGEGCRERGREREGGGKEGGGKGGRAGRDMERHRGRERLKTKGGGGGVFMDGMNEWLDSAS
jgi:hypothetical protein